MTFDVGLLEKQLRARIRVLHSQIEEARIAGNHNLVDALVHDKHELEFKRDDISHALLAMKRRLYKRWYP